MATFFEGLQSPDDFVPTTQQWMLLDCGRRFFARSSLWTRADLRAAGYGAGIDAHIQRGACPPDDWRTSPTAALLPCAAANAEMKRRGGEELDKVLAGVGGDGVPVSDNAVRVGDAG